MEVNNAKQQLFTGSCSFKERGKNRPSQKYGNGKAIRSIELENIIFQNIGGKCGAQLKLMLFLTGNADDGTFSVATKTVCDRCGMTEETYKKARSALVEKGWIIHEEGKIIVDYDAIYNSAKLTEESTYSVKTEETEANRSKDIESTSSQDFQNTYNNVLFISVWSARSQFHRHELAEKRLRILIKFFFYMLLRSNQNAILVHSHDSQ